MSRHGHTWTGTTPWNRPRQLRSRRASRRRGLAARCTAFRSASRISSTPRGLPTENGTVLDAGRQPEDDCAVVAALRQAGAVIMGKTVTTEFAVYAPGKTRNPHNPDHTPGGSSSGSAAAVGAGMVPLAVGSQTNGSVIRPASFCGVWGMKPTHGLISRRGVLALSRTLDTMGTFARSLDDLALATEVLIGFDPADPDTRPRARPNLTEAAAAEPPVTPQLAFVKSPVWDAAGDDIRNGFHELVERLGDCCDEADLPAPFDGAVGWHRLIMNADMARNLNRYYETGKERISDRLRSMIEDGQKVLAVDYTRAVDMRESLYAGLERLFERFDAILTPAATGEAPAGLEATGDPAFCTLWTYLGTPAVTVPLMAGSNGLPIGVQLVGPRGDDARLLRTANWLVRRLAGENADNGTD